MRRLIAVFLFAAVSFVALSSGVADVQAAVPCYCKYSSNGPASANADERRFCPAEVGIYGLVDGFDEITECGQVCIANGMVFAGISKLDDSQYGKDGNMAKDEQDFCVFSHFDSDHLPSGQTPIDGWTSAYTDCKQPLSLITGSYATACSFCYCKFKAGPSTPASCVGKSTMIRATGNPSACNTLCVSQGYDIFGSVETYRDECDYKASDSCAKAVNESHGCSDALANQAQVKQNVISSGSVVTLPLPLSSSSIPKVIGRIINTLVGTVGAIALLMFVWGGLQWMLAAGSQEKVAKAKKTIVWATLGLLAIFSSYAVLNFVIEALT